MTALFDAKVTTVTSQTVYSSPITNAALTVGASGTLVIGVFSATDAATPAVPIAMTWNGIAMSLVTNSTTSDGLTNVYVYAIISPATGNHSLSCTYTNGSGGAHAVDLDGFSYTGTDTSSVANCIPPANIITDASTPGGAVYPASAFTVTTANGDAIACAANARSCTPGTAQIGTTINTEAVNTNNYASLYNLASGSSVQGQFNVAGNTPCCGVAIRIKQSAATTTVQLRPAHITKLFARPLAPVPEQAYNLNLFTNPVPFNQTDWLKSVYSAPSPRPSPDIAYNQNLYSVIFLLLGQEEM